MLKIHGPGAVVAVLAAALVVPPASGQQTAPSPTPAPPAAGSPGAAPVETGRLQRTHGGWRASRIVGAAVYNDRGERIGTVDDLLVGQDGRISQAVLSVGGFLGIGAKLVGVPYGQLRFEEHTDDRTAATGAPPEAPVGTPAGPAPGVPATAPAQPVVSTRVVLPGATRDSLNAQPGFNYRD